MISKILEIFSFLGLAQIGGKDWFRWFWMVWGIRD